MLVIPALRCQPSPPALRPTFGMRRQKSPDRDIQDLAPLSHPVRQLLSETLAAYDQEQLTERNLRQRLKSLVPDRASILARLLFHSPIVETHQGVKVVRDDRLPGGTKSRFLARLLARHDEVVYPSTTWGGAQVALGCMAKLLGEKVTLFVAKRQQLHPRTLEALRVGEDHVQVIQVPHGFLNVLESHARRYCATHSDAHYLAVGANSAAAIQCISQAAGRVEQHHGPFDEVWSVAGSGVLTRGLQAGIQHPLTRFYVVQVGKDIREPGKATVIQHPKKLDRPLRLATPFPSCPHFDRKAWQVCLERKGTEKNVLFWNVLG